MIKILPISERGQITIPKKIREKLKNPCIRYEEQGNKISFELIVHEINDDKKLAQDAEYLSKLNFDDLPTEDEWCPIQSKI